MSEKFSVILADPPWHYSSRKTGGERLNKTRFGGGAEKHYPLIKDKNMRRWAKVLPRICHKNAIMFLWVTMPRLDFGIECMKLAGFRYCTNAFTWLKSTNDGLRFKYGPGHYTASNLELCLVGVRGKGMQPARKMIDSVIITPRFEHSVKPPVHDLLDEMYPLLPKIELFARRNQKAGQWTYWGNQLPQEVSEPVQAASEDDDFDDEIEAYWDFEE